MKKLLLVYHVQLMTKTKAVMRSLKNAKQNSQANNGEAIDEPSEPLTLAHLLDGIEVPEPEPSTLSGGDIMAVMPEVLENHLKRKADRAMRRKLGIIKEEDFNGK